MDKIEELIKCISNCEGGDYISKITSLGLTKEDFEGKINFSNTKYTRTKIAREKDFELILLGWSKGQKTAIHNHNGSEGFVYMLDGKLEEVTYTLNPETNELAKNGDGVIITNQVAYAENDKNEYHSIENVRNGESLSLHLYRKPIDSCMVYDEKSDEIIERELVYDF